jgi:hypothetical protein
LQVVKAEQNMTTQIVNETMNTATQRAVDGISVFLFGGLIASLFFGSAEGSHRGKTLRHSIR